MLDGPSKPTESIDTALSKAEKRKLYSGHLREPLLTELGNDEIRFSEDAVQLLKFHGSYQQNHRELRKTDKIKCWQMMLRLRNPGGRVPAQLFSALDDLSNQYGNGTLRITTRQAFQMHGIPKADLKTVIGTIIENLGSTLAACGDINRNVMAPAAPFENNGYPAARKLADEIADLLSPKAAEGSYLDMWVDGDLSYRFKPAKPVKQARERQFAEGVFSGSKDEPIYGDTYLPRKFKVAVTVSGDNSVDLLTQDIGLVLFTNKNGTMRGCNVYVGGGLGRTHNQDDTFARIADPLGYVEAENIFDLLQSIMALQRDHGDREVRKHARMKYLLHKRGIEWFRETLIKDYFKRDIKKLINEAPAKLMDYLGWHRQKPGLWFVGLPFMCGRLEGDIKAGIRSIVERYQLEIRLTPNQDLLLCNIGSSQKSSIKAELAELGFELPAEVAPLVRHALACPALPTCGLAVTESERILPDVLERLESQLNNLEIKKSILVRMTGCPNGCARPYMAELGLVGSGVNQYQLWLGGSANLQRLARPFLQKMPLEDLEATIEPLLLSWKDAGGRRGFGEHITKLGDATVQEMLKVPG
ncbi:NADPH-dependent assimilatory sulfite reductase hemoprotein subunit [Synechococcus sp. WH 8016]|uniref:NADPH-dependent assimilatory sulfite reductase hemoprotein subunit n=1 Tax=Synechococcus sp. WH 8016 TaxID=166318 RepID=UPI00022D8DC4|nr:NADPH-dependent assimilatory sulfite reductase hemoprotein subunit [Synechococcus sp. WH 8016]EHA63295.1 Sulfite reductase (ferredoxin) [Synechococcus sp. WH 8016]